MKVAIITEGFQGTGYGHLTRCLSIYQAFEEKNITPLYIANCDEEGKIFLPEVNLLQLNWLEQTEEFLNKINNYDIAIIDSYLAPLEMYEKIYQTVKKVVYIDDYLRLEYPPGILVNGTIGAENLPYKKDEKHEYLLGVEYMPLRKEFWDVDVPYRSKQETKNILITFGAQDSKKLTPKVLSFLLIEFPQFNYHVVFGIKTKEDNEQDNVHYYYSLNAGEMVALMLKSDLAITAAGQTTYELARIGIPTIILGVAENQKYNIEGWLNRKFINDEIWFDDENLLEKIEKNINARLNETCDSLVDGQGARRIYESTKS